MMSKPHIKLSTSIYQQSQGVEINATQHDAASASEPAMYGWNPIAGSANSDLIDELSVIVPRARDLARNNGLASGANQTLKDNIVGSVLRLSSKPDRHLLGLDHDQARDWTKNTEAQFRPWSETTECDAGRSLTLLGLTTQALGSAFLNGDAIAIPLWLPRPDSQWSTRLMVIESDRLSTPPHLQHRSDIHGGVEVDKFGAPVAYHIQKQHPGDKYSSHGFGVSIGQWERIPAFMPTGRRRVIHLHDKERSGQSRGKTVFASVMREFKQAGKYTTTELQTSIVNSLISAFIESNLDSQTISEMFTSGKRDPGEYWRQQTGEWRAKLSGGSLINLPLGARVTPFTPNRPNNGFESFMLSVLRHIAAGLNIPYELLTKDFSNTNYSSARAALLEAWRYFQGRRRWLKEYWLDPIYELWMEEAVARGLVHAPDFYQNKYAYTKCRWIHSGRGWVDQVKEATAAKIRMDAGLSTLESECADQGLDYEEVLDQQQREMEMRKERGLAMPGPPLLMPDDENEEKKEVVNG